MCSQPTQRLMEWAFNNNVILLTHMPQDYEAWDYQCSLMSLPRAFQTKLDTIPNVTPYLNVPKAISLHWKARLELAAPNRFRVGIAWAGRKAHQYDARRSLSFKQIIPILNVENITWVSLQKWAPEDEQPIIPQSIDWIDWTNELIDFADTAALVQNLDLVISIDSSMIHLAGALDKPVWMMNRFDCEWRWLESLPDSPWYPSLRIFNQPTFGDWQSVIQEVIHSLKLIDVPDTQAKSRSRDLKERLDKQPQQTLLLAPADLVVSLAEAPPVNVSTSQSHIPQQPTLLNTEQALQLAGQHQAAKRLPEAESILRQVLKVEPKNPHALHLLGVVTYEAGQFILAMDLIRQAIAIEPFAALFESNLAEMNRQQGRVAEAIEHGHRAISLDPTSASAHSNLGIALFDAHQYDEAEACHQRALGLAPQLLQSLNNIGSIKRARGNRVEAIRFYRKVLEISPGFLDSLINLGAVLVEEGRAQEAFIPLQKVLDSLPDSPEALCNLGLAYFMQDDFEKASILLERALQSRPGYPEAQIGIARVLQEKNQLDRALAILLEVTKTAPDKADAWCQLGVIYTEQGMINLAKQAYQNALMIDAKCTDALTGIAHLKLEGGKIEGAISDFNAVLEIDPDHLGARFHLMQAKKVMQNDANLAVLEAKASRNDGLRNDQRIFLNYALGKGYDDLQQYDKAFLHFSEGAKLKRTKITYSAQLDAQRTEKLIDFFTEERLGKLKGAGCIDASPIFILGMPRSGTTLTEQIIASHPEVHGAGELKDLLEIVQQTRDDNVELGFPDNIGDLSKDKLTYWVGSI